MSIRVFKAVSTSYHHRQHSRQFAHQAVKQVPAQGKLCPRGTVHLPGGTIGGISSQFRPGQGITLTSFQGIKETFTQDPVSVCIWNQCFHLEPEDLRAAWAEVSLGAIVLIYAYFLNWRTADLQSTILSCIIPVLVQVYIKWFNSTLYRYLSTLSFRLFLDCWLIYVCICLAMPGLSRGTQNL